MLVSAIAMWQICCTTSCRIVVSLSVGGGVRVVEFGTYCTVHNMCTLQVLGEPLVELFNSLTFIMLAGNPLHCNCELRWFRRWLMNDTESFGKVLDSGDLLCVSPSTLTGRQFNHYYYGVQ